MAVRLRNQAAYTVVYHHNLREFDQRLIVYFHLSVTNFSLAEESPSNVGIVFVVHPVFRIHIIHQ